MTILEAIVFFIIFLGMLALNAKRSLEERRKRSEPEEEEIAPIQKVHVESVPEPDALEEQMIKERTTMTGMQHKLFHSPGEKQAYDIKLKDKELRFLLTKNLKGAVILKEILDKPKGL